MIILKTKKELDKMQDSGYIASEVLNELKSRIKPGVTTKYLNDLAEKITYQHKAVPGFLGYQGFPFTICASVNDEVVHGFPNETPLKEGDIIKIDYGALYNGWYSDSCFTAAVGKVSSTAKKLIDTSEKCLYKAIDKAIPGNRIGDISNIIQTTAEKAGFDPVKNYTGHGVGKNLHEAPQILNYGKPNEGILLKEGMVVAIEPIIAEKSYKNKIDHNKWTVRTLDGGLVAEFEHTIAITNNGPIILTKK